MRAIHVQFIRDKKCFRDHVHNVVTLLAWAEYLQVAPAEPNRYFQAKAAARLDRTEADKRRTLAFSLCWHARFLSALDLGGALVSAVLVVVIEPGQLLRPFGWWTPALVLGAAACGFLIWVIFGAYVFDLPEKSKIKYYCDTNSEPSSGNFIYMRGFHVNAPDWFSYFVWAGLTPIVFAIAATPLITLHLPVYIAVAIAAQVIFWETSMNMFNRDRHYYLYRPNEYVNVYEDPRSRHWLSPTSPGL